MALAGPHVGMPDLRIQSVAVAGFLGPEHGVFQFIHAHGVILPGVNDLLLEQKTAVDVDHRLGGFHQPVLQQVQAFFGPAALQHLPAEHGLVENARGFRQGHRLIAHHVGKTGHAAVVPAVAQLMGQGAYIGEAALEIGHHQAAVREMDGGAESAAGFAFPGIEINPPAVKGVADEGGHVRGKFAHLPHQNFPGILHGELLCAFSDRREQIVEGKPVLVAQQAGLGLQVAAEMGQVFPDRCPQGVQRFAVHAAVRQGHIQNGVEVTGLRQGAGFHLDAVQAVAHGKLHFGIGSDFSVIGILPDSGIRIIGLAAYAGQREFLIPVVHHQRGVQLVPQLAEGFPSGKLHLQDPGLDFRRDQVLCHFLHLQQRETDRFQHIGGFNQLLQVFRLRDETGKC